MLKGVSRTEVDISSIGYKYNMNNVAATIGQVQLKYIDGVLNRHIENGKFFDKELAALSGIDFAHTPAGARSSYWLYTLLSDDAADIEKALVSVGISASKLHRPNNLHSIFANSETDLPGLDDFYAKLLHIPSGWWVTDDDRELIVKTIKRG
jgi:dTDP-4-amino-4,6-dideoxygalactose transaminase